MQIPQHFGLLFLHIFQITLGFLVYTCERVILSYDI